MSDDDIRDVMEDEKGRGKKRPKDAQLRRQERELLKFMREAMKCEQRMSFWPLSSSQD